ncbi:hypothetical protein BGP_6065 [Beggiatoa sp. PS]|nr:hypothetical protein BGP_6065 [Beggiatoa sp. PS]
MGIFRVNARHHFFLRTLPFISSKNAWILASFSCKTFSGFFNVGSISTSLFFRQLATVTAILANVITFDTIIEIVARSANQPISPLAWGSFFRSTVKPSMLARSNQSIKSSKVSSLASGPSKCNSNSILIISLLNLVMGNG